MKTSTKTMLSILMIIIAIVAIVLMVKLGVLDPNVTKVSVDTAQLGVVELSPVSTFSWRYEKGTEDLDGLPKTLVFLDVTYENKKIISKLIEEVQGSCNAIDPGKDDSDMVAGNTKIQCYAAGFGEFYKIVKGTDSYQVMRKHIEEGDPDVAPVDFKYETVMQFPLMQ